MGLLCARKVVREVFCWSRNPTEVRHLAQRKEELYRALLGEHSPPVAPGVKLLLETLTKHQARLFLLLGLLGLLLWEKLVVQLRVSAAPQCVGRLGLVGG